MPAALIIINYVRLMKDLNLIYQSSCSNELVFQLTYPDRAFVHFILPFTLTCLSSMADFCIFHL